VTGAREKRPARRSIRYISLTQIAVSNKVDAKSLS